MKNKLGIIHPSDALIFRNHVGELSNDERGYELFHNVYSGLPPHILSKQTGKSFTLPWEDIVEIAINQGIDTPETKQPEAENEVTMNDIHIEVVNSTSAAGSHIISIQKRIMDDRLTEKTKIISELEHVKDLINKLNKYSYDNIMRKKEK